MLTKEQAIAAMTYNNDRVTHHYFADNEFIYMKEGVIYDENDYRHQRYDHVGRKYDFWSERKGKGWETGWSIFKNTANL